VSLDRRILLFTAGVTLLTGLIFGIVPALAASRTNLNDVLKEGGRDSSGGARSQRVRSAFVVVEVALALVLLVGSGLMMRSLMRLQSVDPGFDQSKLLTARLLLPGQKYQKESQRIDFFKQLVDRMAGTPGVSGATAIDWLPFAAGNSATNFTIEGQPPPEPGNDLVCDVRVSMPNYFELMKIPFIAGRTFSEREATELSHVVVINKTMADRYFPNENPLGQRVRISMMDEPAPCEIIGIVGDAKHASLDADARATAYWPHPELARTLLTVVLRTEGDPLALAGTLQQEVRNLDKDQPIADVSTMEQLVSNSMSRTRFTAVLLAVFAGVALALAAVGIYGVMSYSVEQMTHEIGIRMALGASRGDVVTMIVRSGMALAIAGIVIGLGAAWGLTRFLTALLYQVSATDATSFISIPFVLSAVALVACLVPAIRATRVDPMVALRYE
jgi:putative ABC transport system permease protein